VFDIFWQNQSMGDSMKYLFFILILISTVTVQAKIDCAKNL